jgi:hypothetical protein
VSRREEPACFLLRQIVVQCIGVVGEDRALTSIDLHGFDATPALPCECSCFEGFKKKHTGVGPV